MRTSDRLIFVWLYRLFPSLLGAAIIFKQMANMSLPQRHDMVETLASDRSDQPFNMTVLPRRAWRDRPISDAHGSQTGV